MTTTKPSAGAIRAAKVLLSLQVPPITNDQAIRLAAEIVDRESGLAELLNAMEALDDIISLHQPGMPPLNHEWADLFRRKIYVALAKAEPKDTAQPFPAGRWTEKGTI